MKKAIISGSSGSVGAILARYLHAKKIDVLCLGSRPLNEGEVMETFKYEALYMQISMKNIESLPAKLDLINWDAGEDCVFYNFAWRGETSLTDGSFETQLQNSIYSAKSVQIAKQIGCSKYVNIGTMEETVIENWVKTPDTPCPSRQVNYALCKLTSRDMCKMTAYLEKIDFIHTRLSVPINYGLSNSSYISTTLKKVIDGNIFETPQSTQLFDFISTDDVANAYWLIGMYGKNNSDYYVGCSKPASLAEHFSLIKEVLNCKSRIEFTENNLTPVDQKRFDTSDLTSDTGFKPSMTFVDFAYSLLKL